MAWIKTRTRKDESVYHSVFFRENGRQTSISWDDYADAQHCCQLIDQVGPAKAREIMRIVSSPRHELTVRDFLTRHIDSLTGNEAGTIKRYRAYVANDIGPAIGDIPLAVLSRDDIAAWINDCAAEGHSGKTIKNKRDFLSGALAAAVGKELKANPCEGVRAPRWDREEMVFLERDEYALLRTALPQYWRPLVEFLVTSGCRWSEATALKPAAVDKATGSVRITKAWKWEQGGWKLGVPKTKMSVRTVTVPTKVLDQLDYSKEWLFTNSGRGNRNPDGPVRNVSFNTNVWTPAVARAQKLGLQKSPRVHDLRHTCASWLMQQNRPLPAIQAHLGHESITTTVNTYGHLDRSSGQGNADALGIMLD